MTEERDIVQMAQQEWMEFEMDNETEEEKAKTLTTQQKQQERWEPPKPGVNHRCSHLKSICKNRKGNHSKELDWKTDESKGYNGTQEWNSY